MRQMLAEIEDFLEGFKQPTCQAVSSAGMWFIAKLRLVIGNSSISRSTASVGQKSEPTLPRPPLLETAAANVAEVAPAPIPASMVGTSMPRRSQRRVRSVR
jgi:hypothetical protein